jgi:hypothetical protein
LLSSLLQASWVCTPESEQRAAVGCGRRNGSPVILWFLHKTPDGLTPALGLFLLDILLLVIRHLVNAVERVRNGNNLRPHDICKPLAGRAGTQTDLVG